jgi:hypothetical protein
MDKRENENKEKKISVYSIRLTRKQKEVIKKNKWIKEELDKIVLQYINNYI